ncbi:MAG: hypothetical protein GX443_06805 [Deltaproteobacteria bacterium]|nr:hypothetical protein [Deltaproteobacteria bacterium]
MSGGTDLEQTELLEKLARAIGEWEESPYYLEKDELFDLERFLEDHEATDLRNALEKRYGVPLNWKFWNSSLGYHRLKRAREEIKIRDALQEEKRRKYLEAVETERRAWQTAVRDLLRQQRREQFRVIAGGRGAPKD